MIYKKFKDLELSMLGLGNMRLPIADPEKDRNAIDYAKAEAIIDKALASGINYFDTAYVYNSGDSERCVGQALKKHPRDSFYLATKYHVGANPDYKQVFEQQLERLQTDHIDFYLIHCLMDNNIDTYLTNGCIQFFEQMKEEGKIRYLGFSTHASVETTKRFADVRAWDFAQIQMNYFDWEFSTSKQEYEIFKEREIPVMIMESVRGGRLSDLGPVYNAKLKSVQPDWSISSWAFRWLMNKSNVQVMLSGMSNLEQLEDNLATCANMENALTAEQSDYLIQVVRDFKSSFTVPCTGCRYCTEDCPQGLEIPALIKVYNEYKFESRWSKNALKDFADDKKPSACVGCGNCAERCPQNIDVPGYMAKLTRLQETGKED